MKVRDDVAPRVVFVSGDAGHEREIRTALGASFVVDHYNDVAAFASAPRTAPELFIVERRLCDDIAADVTKLLGLFGYAAPPIAVMSGNRCQGRGYAAARGGRCLWPRGRSAAYEVSGI